MRPFSRGLTSLIWKLAVERYDPIETFEQTIVYGVGLLGGSIGLAAKIAKCGGKIVGLGRSEEKLKRAASLGAIDAYATSWREALELCEPGQPTMIIFALPVETNIRALRELWDLRFESWFKGRDYVISDVGSAKKGFAQAGEELLRTTELPENTRVVFVPAHPIAGSDKSGVEYARADLFRNKLTILTPWTTAVERQDALSSMKAIPSDFSSMASHSIAGVDFDMIRRVRVFWSKVGARVLETSAEEHDQILARTSHLPNLASVLTMSVVPLDEFLFTGTGFRDVTRLSGSSPEMWVEIYSANHTAVLDALERMEEQILRWKQFLKDDDSESILNFLHETKKKRDALGS
ncbi:MAG: prephenate dehydrogenase [Thermoguttaceae bacterium]|nr:prephenate dehydrogenase [Thermoguttaceae bacterium]